MAPKGHGDVIYPGEGYVKRERLSVKREKAVEFKYSPRSVQGHEHIAYNLK